jgi:trehalose utilization protein
MADTKVRNGDTPIRVLVWDENPPHAPKELYPKSINGAIGDGLNELSNGRLVVTLANLNDPEQGISEQALSETDVLLWWGHARHEEVSDATTERVRHAVHENGLGFMPLHSGHHAKPFKAVLDCTGDLQGGWREVPGFEVEEVTVAAPRHPIAQGIENFVLEQEEMYGSPFGIPPHESIVFQSYFPLGGEYFPCGFTTTVGKGIDPTFTTGRNGTNRGEGAGRVFYFRPGHETVPTYYHPIVKQILFNGVLWVARAI